MHDCVQHSSGLHQVFFFFFLPHGCYARTSGHTTQPEAPSMFPAHWPAAATEQGTLLPGAQTHITIRGCVFFFVFFYTTSPVTRHRHGDNCSCSSGRTLSLNTFHFQLSPHSSTPTRAFLCGGCMLSSVPALVLSGCSVRRLAR